MEPATPDQFEEIFPLLREFPHHSLSKEEWRRMLFDPPWPVEEPHRGYLLREGQEVVGFIGTIFSARSIQGRKHRFCNLSSWIVKESYRSSSLQLVLPILAMKDHTIVNLTASETALEIFGRLGFRTLEDRQLLVAPLPDPRAAARLPGSRVTTRLAEIRERLTEAEQEILDHMSGTFAAQALLRRGERHCHVIATASSWKRGRRLAHVHYASDWELFWKLLPLAAWAFFRKLGTLGLRVDGRRSPRERPLFAVRRKLALPTLYRPAEPEITPDVVDGLYSELVCQRW